MARCVTGHLWRLLFWQMAVCHVVHPAPGKPYSGLITIQAIPPFLSVLSKSYTNRLDLQIGEQMQRGLERQKLALHAALGKKGQTREIQHKPEQTWHYSCNLRQLSQDLYTWSHVTQAGNERQGSLVVVIKETNPGAAPLAMNDRQTFWTDSASEVMPRKVKQTFFESISLRFIVSGVDPRFVSRRHQIIASALWFLALCETCWRR